MDCFFCLCGTGNKTVTHSYVFFLFLYFTCVHRHACITYPSNFPIWQRFPCFPTQKPFSFLSFFSRRLYSRNSYHFARSWAWLDKKQHIKDWPVQKICFILPYNSTHTTCSYHKYPKYHPALLYPSHKWLSVFCFSHYISQPMVQAIGFLSSSYFQEQKQVHCCFLLKIEVFSSYHTLKVDRQKKEHKRLSNIFWNMKRAEYLTIFWQVLYIAYNFDYKNINKIYQWLRL